MDIIVSVECQAHWEPQLFVPPAETFQIDLLRPIIQSETPCQRQYTDYLSNIIAHETKGDTKMNKNDQKEEEQHMIESIKLSYITVLVHEALSKA